MLKPKILIAVLLALLIQGCIPSIHPLYSNDTIEFRESLLGEWNEEDGSTWSFEKGEDDSYIMSFASEEEDNYYFRVYLVKLGKYYFFDFFRMKDKESAFELEAFAPLLPTHSFAKVTLGEKQLKIHLLNEEWLKALFEQRKIRIKHEEMKEGYFVLTAPTDDLQKFVVKYAEEKDAFENAFTLGR